MQHALLCRRFWSAQLGLTWKEMIPSSKKYPGTTPLWMLWKAPQLSCPTTLSCKKDGPAHFILITHYLQHRNLAGIRGVLIQSSRSIRQITVSIADCCFARVTTQWGLRIPLLQSCFARKTEDHVQDDKWPLAIWLWGCTCWHNFNLPFKQALQHLNVPVQTITCLLASKNEFHNFTRYALQTKITSPHIIHLGKGLPGIQSIPSEIRGFQMQANKNHISRILYINWNLNWDSLAPSISIIEITIASFEFLGCSTCSIKYNRSLMSTNKGIVQTLEIRLRRWNLNSKLVTRCQLDNFAAILELD
jgi:hypothetical protein